jgi:hypothetical protein
MQENMPGRGSITAQGECGGSDPWDFFPVPQFGIRIGYISDKR